MSEFRAVPRELLERHIAESAQPNRATSELAHAPEQEPTRPEGHYGERYAQGQGNYVSETTAAEKNNKIVNREYLDYQAEKGSQPRQDARAALEEHIEKSATAPGDRGAARAALEQHLKDAGRETPEPKIDPGERTPQPLDIER